MVLIVRIGVVLLSNPKLLFCKCTKYKFTGIMGTVHHKVVVFNVFFLSKFFLIVLYNS